MNFVSTAIVGTIAGSFTAWNITQAGLECARRYDPSFHIRLRSEQTEKITLIVTTIFFALYCLSVTSAIVASPFYMTHSELYLALLVALTMGLALPLLLNSKVEKRVFQYLNQCFCRLDNTKFEQIAQENNWPIGTIQWGFSEDRLLRQSFYLLEALIYTAALFLFSFSCLIVVACMINIVIKLYSCFHISRQKEIKVVSPTILLTEDQNGVRFPVMRILQGQFVEITGLRVYALITPIPSPHPREKKCPICLEGAEAEEIPVDMQVCTVNHSTHAKCFAASLVNNIINTPFDVTSVDPLVIIDEVLFVVSVSKAKNPFRCSVCREKSPFVELKAEIDYSLNGIKKTTSRVDIVELGEGEYTA